MKKFIGTVASLFLLCSCETCQVVEVEELVSCDPEGCFYNVKDEGGIVIGKPGLKKGDVVEVCKSEYTD